MQSAMKDTAAAVIFSYQFSGAVIWNSLLKEGKKWRPREQFELKHTYWLHSQ